jgi:glutamyl-tRNA synthetase
MTLHTSTLPSNAEMTDLIFATELSSVEHLEAQYPPRVLPEGALVTRFAPSPTGFLHIGGVYMALISERFAHQSGGVYFVRVEDTDQKRYVQGAEDIVHNGLRYFGLTPDETAASEGDRGMYGPYRQSERKDIYHACMKYLLEIGRAYPCFCTEEELETMKAQQTELSVRPGYYGVWAKWRDADPELVREQLASGVPYVLRLKSQGDPNKTVILNDLIKGRIELPENDTDVVIMKRDGLPTYHFAHAVDDHFMRVTHIIRADEWLSSVPIHFELFDALGFERLPYGHIAPINKFDGESKRKLSKRKDPEANVEYYQNLGYPGDAVIEYLLNLANSEFEDWRKSNPDADWHEFTLTWKRLSQSSGPLFDEQKLRDIAKDVISRFTLDQFYDAVVRWADVHDDAFSLKLSTNPDYWKRVFSIERGQGKRKDIATYSEVYPFYAFFDVDAFGSPDWTVFDSVLTADEIRLVLSEFAGKVAGITDSDQFMSVMREIAGRLGFAENLKAFKANPDGFRGHVGAITQPIRYAITGRTMSPDLFEVVTVLGADEVVRRLGSTL